MVRINFIVEGATEEEFVRTILTPYLSTRGVFPSVRSIQTSRNKNKIFRGGMTHYSKARNDILRWMKEDQKAYLTTMFDYYGLPKIFPGVKEAKRIKDLYKKVNHIEECMKDNIQMEKFIPYIQLHEFETLLFSDIDNIDDCMALRGQNGRINQLKKIYDEF